MFCSHDDLFSKGFYVNSYDKFHLIFLVARQQKFLRAKIGGVEEEMDDDDDDDEEEEDRAVWGRSKNNYYNADNIDYEVSCHEPKLSLLSVNQWAMVLLILGV